MRDLDQLQPMTYSVIPSDGVAHAVWGWMIRAACLDPGTVKLQAVCCTEVTPEHRLPTPEAACTECRAALPPNAIARPAPGSPMLHELARIHAEMAR
jgi:hypothetical protein